jgi:hypothetical protein
MIFTGRWGYDCAIAREASPTLAPAIPDKSRRLDIMGQPRMIQIVIATVLAFRVSWNLYFWHPLYPFS